MPSVVLECTCEAAARQIAEHGDEVERFEILMTGDAVPVLAERLPDLWAMRVVRGVPVEWPEFYLDPRAAPPRTVRIRAFGSRYRVDTLATAECLRDAI